MKQKVFRVGKHSLAIVIPAHFAHTQGIISGDIVEVKTNSSTGKITLEFSGSIQLALPASDLAKKYEK